MAGFNQLGNVDGMDRLELRHTWTLEPPELASTRSLLDDAFEGDFSDADWDHALGGLHCLAWEDDMLVGHAAVVQRQLLHGGQAFRCGYVEAMAVHSDHRRRGIGAAIMEAIDAVVVGGYAFGALGATDDGAPLYARHGWTSWRGPTYALTPDGVTRTADADDAIMVLDRRSMLDLDGELACDWRAGDLW